MTSLPRPLLALLVVAVAFFALWMVVLRPHASSGVASPQAVSRVIAQAHPSATPPATTQPHETSTLKPRAAIHPPKATPAAASGAGPAAVSAALKADKVVAVLFYNPAAADDAADAQELSGLATHGGLVAKFAVPIAELAQYPVVSDQVPVSASPTLVVIDRHHQATSTTGYIDPLALNQLVAAALPS